MKYKPPCLAAIFLWQLFHRLGGGHDPLPPPPPIPDPLLRILIFSTYFGSYLENVFGAGELKLSLLHRQLCRAFWLVGLVLIRLLIQSYK